MMEWICRFRRFWCRTLLRRVRRLGSHGLGDVGVISKKELISLYGPPFPASRIQTRSIVCGVRVRYRKTAPPAEARVFTNRWNAMAVRFPTAHRRIEVRPGREPVAMCLVVR